MPTRPRFGVYPPTLAQRSEHAPGLAGDRLCACMRSVFSVIARALLVAATIALAVSPAASSQRPLTAKQYRAQARAICVFGTKQRSSFHPTGDSVKDLT